VRKNEWWARRRGQRGCAGGARAGAGGMIASLVPGPKAIVRARKDGGTQRQRQRNPLGGPEEREGELGLSAAGRRRGGPGSVGLAGRRERALIGPGRGYL
jgi:hypothetical protein